MSAEELNARIIFTDVAPKNEHISRGAAADIFLDTPECNAHTTAADILWAGTPMITYPKVKMASRVAASICIASGEGDEMVVRSYEEYEKCAVDLATDRIRLMQLRRRLLDSRETSKLFDTQRWVRNFERGFEEAWKRYLEGRPKDSFAIVDPDDVEYVQSGTRARAIQESIPQRLHQVVRDLTGSDASRALTRSMATSVASSSSAYIPSNEQNQSGQATSFDHDDRRNQNASALPVFG
jgi:hypothetical protein